MDRRELAWRLVGILGAVVLVGYLALSLVWAFAR